MLFNSIDYLIFLPLVLVMYHLIPKAHRWVMLLAVSYYFYMSWSTCARASVRTVPLIANR